MSSIIPLGGDRDLVYALKKPSRNLLEEDYLHELAVTESIAAICLKHAQANNAERVLKVNIKLGELTGIVDHYVSFYWDLVTKDTVAQGAELNFIKIPVRAFCTHCREEFAVEEYDLTCPRCGGTDSELVSGREFTVESLEIE
jgi:hydrogenase nickel incorporation protein HypA/HybF